MLRGVFALALLLASLAFATEVARIQRGDVLGIQVLGFKEYTVETKVVSDGTVSGPGFGTVPAAGRTLEQVRDDVRARLRAYLADPQVFVTFVRQLQPVVYVLGLEQTASPTDASGSSEVALPGQVPYRTGMTLTHVLAGGQFSGAVEDLEISIRRGPNSVFRADLARVLDAEGAEGAFALEPGDAVIVQPKPTIRLWVTGPVRYPGEVRLKEGSTLDQAIAKAGGLDPNNALLRGGDSGQPIRSDKVRIVVRRGERAFDFPAVLDADASKFGIEAGDTISVLAPSTVSVVIGGEVFRPGQVSLSEDATLLAAIGVAGGIRPTGTLAGVLVFRQGQVFRFDLTESAKRGTDVTEFALQSDDLIHVLENQATYYVLGEVRQPGRVAIPDGEEMRLAGVVSLAGGLTTNGSYRRMIVMRADDKGVYQPHSYNLDEYLKDGKAEANPRILPGDVVFVSPPRGRITIGELTQVVSAAVLLDTFVRRR